MALPALNDTRQGPSASGRNPNKRRLGYVVDVDTIARLRSIESRLKKQALTPEQRKDLVEEFDQVLKRMAKSNRPKI